MSDLSKVKLKTMLTKENRKINYSNQKDKCALLFFCNKNKMLTLLRPLIKPTRE